MTQQQLFPAGNVRIISRAKRNPITRARQRRVLGERLVGSGLIRIDPLTGIRYDVDKGIATPRIAYLWRCDCGNEVWASRSRWRRRGRRCADCGRRSSAEAQSKPDGSRRLDGSYVLVKHNGDWVREHRLVMAAAIGRDLRDDETVHHINGDRTDNRLDNLQLRRGHHGAGQAHVCVDCGSSNVIAVPLRGGGGS